MTLGEQRLAIELYHEWWFLIAMATTGDRFVMKEDGRCFADIQDIQYPCFIEHHANSKSKGEAHLAKILTAEFRCENFTDVVPVEAKTKACQTMAQADFDWREEAFIPWLKSVIIPHMTILDFN